MEFVRQIPESLFGTEDVSVVVDVFQLDVWFETIAFFELRGRPVESITPSKFVVVAEMFIVLGHFLF